MNANLGGHAAQRPNTRIRSISSDVVHRPIRTTHEWGVAVADLIPIRISGPSYPRVISEATGQAAANAKGAHGCRSTLRGRDVGTPRLG